MWLVIAKQLAELEAAVFEPLLAIALEGLLQVGFGGFAMPDQDVLCGSIAISFEEATAFDDRK